MTNSNLLNSYLKHPTTQRTKILLVGIIGIPLLSLSSPLQAAPYQDGPSITQSVNKCARISSAPKRLQCFDQITGRHTSVLSPASLTNVPKTRTPTLKTRKVKSPGPPSTPLNSESKLKMATKPKLGAKEEPREGGQEKLFNLLFPKNNKGKEDIKSEVIIFTSVEQGPDGKWVFKTKTGQAWQQTDSKIVTFPTVPFSAVIINEYATEFYMKPLGRSVSLTIKPMK